MPLILQSKDYVLNNIRHLTCPDVALYRCYYKKVLWKYAANLRESTHGEATLLKSHFGMGVFLSICCIFSKHLFLRTHLEGCFCISSNINKIYLLQFVTLLEFKYCILIFPKTIQEDTYVCVSGGKKFSFFWKFGVLCFLVIPILRFALLPYYRWVGPSEFCNDELKMSITSVSQYV